MPPSPPTIHVARNEQNSKTKTTMSRIGVSLSAPVIFKTERIKTKRREIPIIVRANSEIDPNKRLSVGEKNLGRFTPRIQKTTLVICRKKRLFLQNSLIAILMLTPLKEHFSVDSLDDCFLARFLFKDKRLYTFPLLPFGFQSIILYKF